MKNRSGYEAMTEEEFDQYREESLADLRRKQRMLSATYGLGEWKDFWYEQETSKLQFKDATGTVRVEAVVLPIGSFSSKSNTWLWSWANESLINTARARSERIKELYEITGLELFRNTGSGDFDEEMAWEITAMAVRHVNALGCYRMPFGTSQFFEAIESIVAVK